LVAAEDGPVEGPVLEHGLQGAHAVAAARQLDLDDVGAEVAEEGGSEGGGDDGGEVEHAEPGQRPGRRGWRRLHCDPSSVRNWRRRYASAGPMTEPFQRVT